ncbi:eukaryotic translation elongation factor 1 epsilon-1 [Episyrphus balteatus]|uniref:eukaryotic translation elongation factor 1 epsilon-1 n=1 Tax=Episyrphus balteatus TaxID=286459 RepID=UPI002486B628|nr:eukaryotic translation elongation factor 1 epsilon-1 [Episyrphus balteatus]
MCDAEAVTKIATCLGVPIGKVAYNSEKIVTRTSNNETATGFANILSMLAKESQSEAAKNSISSVEVEAQVQQWIEYAILYVAPGSKDKHVAQHLLRDFNNYFLSRSYLVGYTLTLADLAVFVAITDLIKSLSPIEKENYLNLSRWFNHIQNRPEVNQGNEVNFTTVYLHGSATHK